jgi:hypothetical protein
MEKRRFGLLSIAWRILIVALGATLGTVIGGLLVTAMQLPVPEVPGLDPMAALAMRPVSGVLLALVLAPIALRLDVPTRERTGILFLLLFGLNTLVNVIEGSFFTTWLGQAAVGTLVAAAPGNLLTAWLLALLFKPPSVTRTFFDAFSAVFAKRTALAWLARFVAAGLVFVPIYYFFGRLIYPFVQSYYEDPAFALGLRVPSVEEILTLQVGRGLLFVVLVLPLAVLLPDPWWQRGLLIGVAIAALMGWEPLLTNTAWPVALRIVHALEITADSLAHGMAIAALLAAPGHVPSRRPAPPVARATGVAG